MKRILIETALREGPYRFKTISGDVALVVPTDTRCTVHFQRISGRFKSELPITRRQSITFEVQGGGPLLQLNTTSGNLTRSLPPGERPETWQANRSPEAERSVLERIASGELSAEEGLEALKN